MTNKSEMTDEEYAEELESDAGYLQGAGFDSTNIDTMLECSRRIKRLVEENKMLKRLSQPQVQVGVDRDS